jgi:hypothetical protein
MYELSSYVYTSWRFSQEGSHGCFPAFSFDREHVSNGGETCGFEARVLERHSREGALEQQSGINHLNALKPAIHKSARVITVKSR